MRLFGDLFGDQYHHLSFDTEPYLGEVLINIYSIDCRATIIASPLEARRLAGRLILLAQAGEQYLKERQPAQPHPTSGEGEAL